MKVRTSITLKRSNKDSKLIAVVDHIKGYPNHPKLESLFFESNEDIQALGPHDIVKIMELISTNLFNGDYEEFRMH